ncbi:OmpA family protein [Frankia sp. AgB32]|uniref:OmpA family protein n=1 Tax=Frankia sp. AgB32 TaxID=631119 RepID=UPI0027E28CEA|nr:OmpA family protein [Frankia sp. AgB32]
MSLLLAWLLLALIAFALRRGPIQDDLAARASAAVKAAGGVHAQVHIEGRTAVVTGRFPSAAAAEQARASAAVSGTTSARLGNDVVIASEPARPLVLAVVGKDLSITATVPDRDSRARLLAAVADAGGGAVRGTVTVDPTVAEPPVEAVPALAAALRRVPGNHSATLRSGAVAVAGSVPDAATARSLGAAVLAAAGPSVPGATLSDQLVVPRSAPASAAPTPSAPTPSAAGSSGAASSGAAPSGSGADSAGSTQAAVRAALGAAGVTFPVSGSRLNAAARARLDQVAAALRAGTITVLVGGYTDTSGPSRVNQALSLSRAQTVADYLVSRGVPAERVRAAGFGSEEPVGDNRTARGRAANRRIEIIPVPPA